MTKRTIPNQSYNSVFDPQMSSSPSTPKRNPKQRKHNFETPVSDNIDEDDLDQDTSPYSRSYSQIAGAEVTWGKRKTPVPSKSKPYVRAPDTTPPLSKRIENVDEKPRTPCGFFKFKKKLEQMKWANSELNTDSGQGTSSSDFITELEDVATTSKLSNSINLKQLLDDSIDMDLILCSQKIERDISRLVEPLNEPIASKGFVDGLNSDDYDDSLFDDAFLLDDNALIQKSIYPRHKSMHPITTSKPHDTTGNTNSNNVNSAIAKCSVVAPSNSSAQPSAVQPFSRHQSMSSSSVTASLKQCTPAEIELKRQQANAKLKLRNKLK